MKVIHDRMKRGCETPLTKYCLKAYRKHQYRILNPVLQKQRLNGALSAGNGDMPSMMVPLVHQYAQFKQEPTAVPAEWSGNALIKMQQIETEGQRVKGTTAAPILLQQPRRFEGGSGGECTYAMVVFVDKAAGMAQDVHSVANSSLKGKHDYFYVLFNQILLFCCSFFSE